MSITPADHAQFFTATISEWRPILRYHHYKNIIVDSLRFLIKEKRVILYAFVIMPNHLHLIWQILEPHKSKDVQRDFLKYTSQQIKADLKRNYPKLLEVFRVNTSDREYQIWKRASLIIPLWSEGVFLQKLEYIHLNPLKAELCQYPEDYEYSSAAFYELGRDHFEMVTHHAG